MRWHVPGRLPLNQRNRGVREYRFRVLQTNKIDAEFILKASSDDEACEIATDLLEEADCPLIEVWQAAQQVCVVRKIACDLP